MKVLLINVDSKRSNLALMKISAWHKSRGDEVFLNKCCNPDKVYISCIFSKNRSKALGIAKMFNCDVEVGGYGVNDKQLPREMEHIMPDYSLYGIQYSVGYTSRGCIRKCPWCIIPDKEGNIRDHAQINEFYVPAWRKLILYDNNFLASPRWYENLREMIDRKIKVSFNQGLDIRLLDQENVKLLAKTLYYDDQFKNRRLYFAFDLPQIEPQVIKGIKKMKRMGISPSHLMFYVLTGFNTSYDEDLHRINLLISQGAKPYVMTHNDRRDSYYPHLERWINGRYYKICEWEKYSSGNSQKIIKSLSN